MRNLRQTEALNDYITFSLIYKNKAFELQISYRKEDEDIDFIQLVKQSDMDALGLYNSDTSFAAHATVTDIQSFLKKDVKMSDYLTYKLPDGYVDGSFNVMLGINGGNPFLKDGKQPRDNDSPPVEWYAPGQRI